MESLCGKQLAIVGTASTRVDTVPTLIKGNFLEKGSIDRLEVVS